MLARRAVLAVALAVSAIACGSRPPVEPVVIATPPPGAPQIEVISRHASYVLPGRDLQLYVLSADRRHVMALDLAAPARPRWQLAVPFDDAGYLHIADDAGELSLIVVGGSLE